MTKVLLAIISIITFSFASIDINHANEKELSSLKGVGASKAKAIVQYRKKHGCFKDMNSLTLVKGLGMSIIKKNHDNLSLTPCKK